MDREQLAGIVLFILLLALFVGGMYFSMKMGGIDTVGL